MKGKISIKTIIVLVILLLVGVLSVFGVNAVQQYVSGAAGGTEPKGVLATPGADGKTGVVVWATDKPAQGVVEYGTTPASLLLRSLETDATTDHRLTLSPLKPNTSYYFRIRTGDQIYDNSGIPYSFKTKSNNDAIPTTSAKIVPTVVTVLPTTAVVPVVGGCDRTVDYNKDGVVNTVDYIKCIRDGAGTKPPVAESTPSGVVKCKPGVDFDNNGVINSLDVIKCLQTQK